MCFNKKWKELRIWEFFWTAKALVPITAKQYQTCILLINPCWSRNWSQRWKRKTVFSVLQDLVVLGKALWQIWLVRFFQKRWIPAAFLTVWQSQNTDHTVSIWTGTMSFILISAECRKTVTPINPISAGFKMAWKKISYWNIRLLRLIRQKPDGIFCSRYLKNRVKSLYLW